MLPEVIIIAHFVIIFTIRYNVYKLQLFIPCVAFYVGKIKAIKTWAQWTALIFVSIALSLHIVTTDMGPVHRTVCLFTSQQPNLVVIYRSRKNGKMS